MSVAHMYVQPPLEARNTMRPAVLLTSLLSFFLTFASARAALAG